MRQLRRLAVTALIAPIAAVGATMMIASPAKAAPAQSGAAQPGSWDPGSWLTGSWNPGSGKYGSWNPGSWLTGPGGRGPSWSTPSQPTPSQPTPSRPTPSAPAGSSEQAVQTEINRLVNVQRTSNGCAALTVNDQLTAAARGHSAWMAQTGTMSHTGSGGSTFSDRVKAAGYAQPSAENVAMGQRTAAEVVNGWMNSSGHRKNILNCQSKAVGVGVVHAANGTPYYTQDFGY
ncbi:CAP domain-containing protein [Actinoplanes regularis]|uniref:CAP domain-containing protein n=1 Tax=Actinoplanes regularis TaxID=52697 RepID=UPI0024A25636|nr:CAP domain-containing protein [Actinoplanes regularis]GLW35750.1 hypothetical protein Areg01_86850 [Actinoplanes regularis]